MIEKKEIKALISLLNDDDHNIIAQVEKKILSLTSQVIPHLEQAWKTSSNPTMQRRIEELVHALQYQQIKNRIQAWYADDSKDLLTGMWIIATYQYPDTTLKKLQKDIYQIYQHVQTKFYSNCSPFHQIKTINEVFFRKLKFGANSNHFHSPGNSLINITLETHKGNPITLGVIYMLIAQKLNLPIYGVNLPNLFILTYKNNQDVPFYINVFNHGIVFSKQDIKNYIAELHIPSQEAFFEPCSHVDIIKRALRNLVLSFEKMGEHAKANEVRQLIHTEHA